MYCALVYVMNTFVQGCACASLSVYAWVDVCLLLSINMDVQTCIWNECLNAVS